MIVLLSLFLFNAASNTAITGLQNAIAQEHNEKSYVLLFESNKIGNVDNYNKIVSAIVGSNLIKIEEDLLEEISLTPSEQLKEQMDYHVTLLLQQKMGKLLESIVSCQEII